MLESGATGKSVGLVYHQVTHHMDAQYRGRSASPRRSQSNLVRAPNETQIFPSIYKKVYRGGETSGDVLYFYTLMHYMQLLVDVDPFWSWGFQVH